MNISAIETALFLLRLTDDPLYASAINTLTSKDASPETVANVEKFIETGWAAYLTLFRNSDKHVEHEPRSPISGTDGV